MGHLDDGLPSSAGVAPPETSCRRSSLNGSHPRLRRCSDHLQRLLRSDCAREKWGKSAQFGIYGLPTGHSLISLVKSMGRNEAGRTFTCEKWADFSGQVSCGRDRVRVPQRMGRGARTRRCPIGRAGRPTMSTDPMQIENRSPPCGRR